MFPLGGSRWSPSLVTVSDDEQPAGLSSREVRAGLVLLWRTVLGYRRDSALSISGAIVSCHSGKKRSTVFFSDSQAGSSDGARPA